MACGVPVLGKIPDLQPSWMTQENGVWITDLTLITDFIADFVQNWLEDNIKPELYENMDKTVEQFKSKQKFTTDVINLFESYLTTRANQLEEQISKL
jgi:glycosyltransferase involved in cell wall biosynthesis